MDACEAAIDDDRQAITARSRGARARSQAERDALWAGPQRRARRDRTHRAELLHQDVVRAAHASCRKPCDAVESRRARSATSQSPTSFMPATETCIPLLMYDRSDQPASRCGDRKRGTTSCRRRSISAARSAANTASATKSAARSRGSFGADDLATMARVRECSTRSACSIRKNFPGRHRLRRSESPVVAERSYPRRSRNCANVAAATLRDGRSALRAAVRSRAGNVLRRADVTICTLHNRPGNARISRSHVLGGRGHASGDLAGRWRNTDSSFRSMLPRA